MLGEALGELPGALAGLGPVLEGLGLGASASAGGGPGPGAGAGADPAQAPEVQAWVEGMAQRFADRLGHAAAAPRALALDPEASPSEVEPEPEPSPATTPTASLQTRGPHAVQEHYQLGQKLRHKIGKARRPPGDDDDLNPFILEVSERFGRSRIDADSLQDSAEDLQRQVQMALLQANSPPRGERPLSRRIAF